MWVRSFVVRALFCAHLAPNVPPPQGVEQPQ
jgi:hypothetical protein